MAKKKIEEKYKEMDEISHILLRPGMWVGSVKEESKELFLLNNKTNKITQDEVSFIPAMLKVVDEVISNSCDEYRRKDNMGLTKLDVIINKNGNIIIRDNGGIPIEKHKVAKCYLPEFIFGRLRTSSNYDDTEDRNVIGTNGVGSSLTNVFSKKFRVRSADKKNSFSRSWSNNMRTLNDDLEIKPCKDHYTETNFDLDFEKFDKCKGFTEDFIRVIEKRCVDAAAANLGLTVSFEYKDGKNVIRSSKWKFKSFEEYIELFTDFVNIKDVIKFSDKLQSYWIYPDSNINVGFVNGAECNNGTHIRAIRTPINSFLNDFIGKKYKFKELTPRSIENKYSVFCNCNISNPAYDSQTKETLTTPIENFSKDSSYKFEVPERFLNTLKKSEIVNLVVDWYKKKVAAEDEKTLRKLNQQASKGLKRSDKYIPCNSRKKQEKQLWVYEGDSAARGLRTSRDPQTQAGYLMRGVVPNSLDMSSLQIMKNDVFNDLISIIGLKFGKEFNINDINFGKIVISTDADTDGDRICALLLLFFSHWPELFKKKIVCRSISPIILAYKGKDTKKYYSLKEFKEDEKKLKGYQIKYAKGLSGLNAAETKEMMRQPIFMHFDNDDNAEKYFNMWFGSDADVRKRLMEK